jgi:hypothetical protein
MPPPLQSPLYRQHSEEHFGHQQQHQAGPEIEAASPRNHQHQLQLPTSLAALEHSVDHSVDHSDTPSQSQSQQAAAGAAKSSPRRSTASTGAGLTSPAASNTLAQLGVSPMVLKAMTERHPGSSPVHSPSARGGQTGSGPGSGSGSPSKRLGFHLRSPATPKK